MIERRPFSELGGANHGWLHARHHFSFANYYDPKRMNWGALRVCALGDMQCPPLAWRHDGRPALADLVTWCDWEK